MAETGTGSSFRRHFVGKTNFWVFLGFLVPVARGEEVDIWARKLLYGVEYVEKISRF